MDKKTEEILLKTYSVSTKKSISELRKLLETAKETAKEMGNESDNVVKGLFLKKINRILFLERTGTTFKARETYTFKGFLLGADSKRDLKGQMRRKAKREYDERGDEAKLEGFVDESGEPIDWRPTIKNRKGQEVDNPDYHKPILGHHYVRDIFGIVMKGEDKTPKLFQMSLWGPFASLFTFRPFTPIEFKCTMKSEGQFYILNAPRVARGEKAFRSITMDIDYEDWIRAALKDREYKLIELDDAIANIKNARDPWILTEALVDNIDPEIDPKNDTRSVRIADGDSGMTDTVKISIPKDFPLAFREFSKVLVFGRPRSWQPEEEAPVMYFINGISIYPIPGQTIEAKLEEGASASGETEEEGWDLWE